MERIFENKLNRLEKISALLSDMAIKSKDNMLFVLVHKKLIHTSVRDKK